MEPMGPTDTFQKASIKVWHSGKGFNTKHFLFVDRRVRHQLAGKKKAIKLCS